MDSNYKSIMLTDFLAPIEKKTCVKAKESTLKTINFWRLATSNTKCTYIHLYLFNIIQFSYILYAVFEVICSLYI